MNASVDSEAGPSKMEVDDSDAAAPHQQENITSSQHIEESHYTGMSSEEYKQKAEDFLKTLDLTPEERHQLEQDTIGQSNNKLWKESRRIRLTASNFHEICHMRPNTSCKRLVQDLLYPKEREHSNMIYGKGHEPDAIKALEKEHSVKVQPCGLFVDEDIPYLGASPDGLIGSDGIVEVMCPSSAEDMTIEEAVENNKVPVLKKSSSGKTQDFEINKDDKLYYQVQGQLHITKRKYCILGIWTPKEIHTKKIKRDDDFWKNEMEPKLICFYENCVLPEIIDPQYPRRPIRDPQYIRDAQEKKKEKPPKKRKNNKKS